MGSEQVLVVGSGPAGLSCAAELGARGVATVVLERGDRVAAAWAGRCPALRFNTSRRLSALPESPFRRELGQFPTRDQYVAYLESYADARGVRVETRTEVRSIRPAHDGGWLVGTSDGDRLANDVVVATGLFNRPVVPAWARGAAFDGVVVHAADFRDPHPYVDREVLVAGAGTTGLEIAHQLSRGGARSVHLAVRTPPNLMLRTVGGLPADLPVPLLLRLPVGPVDRLLQWMQPRVVGDLAAYGLPVPEEGPLAGLRRRGTGTAVVDPEVLDAVRDGSVHVVPAVESLDERGAVLVDGQRLRVDAVIAATGYTTGLEALVGGLGVLDDLGRPLDGLGGEVAPGLRFLGFVARPGITGHVGRLSRRVAEEISEGLIRERSAAATAGRRARDGSPHRASRRST